MVWLGSANLRMGTSSSEVGEMRDSTAALREGDVRLLRGRLQTDGYLLLRDLIPAGSVQAGCACITEEMGRGGWFEGDPAERIARAGGPGHSLGPVDDKFSATNGAMLRPSEARAVCNSADGEVLRVLEAPELHAAFELLFGEPATTVDYKWFRTVRPPAEPGKGSLNGSGIFHCDKVSAAANRVANAPVRTGSAAQCARARAQVYMGRGSSRLTTAWIPWHAIEPQDGGLAVLQGSSFLDGFDTLRRTYVEHDVSNTDIDAGGAYGSDPLELSALDPSSQWVTTTYKAGDVLLFGMATMHGPLSATRPGPPRIRLSTDTRWQPARDAVDDRHTTGLGPDDALWRKHGKYGLDWARDSKALNPHKGRWRTMEEAKREWGLLPKL